MKIALAQINSHLGDFKSNREKILHYIKKANNQNCDLIVFPELSLFGYTNSDLMMYRQIVQKELRELKILHNQIPKNMTALIGAITINQNKKGKPYQNSALLLQYQKKIKVFPKTLLPSYDVFDENRHFEPESHPFHSFSLKSRRIALSICEDIWAWERKGLSNYSSNPFLSKKKKTNTHASRPKPIDFFINMSASPFTKKKHALRDFYAKKTSNYFQSPFLFLNRVGGEDELIFDGRSFILDKKGQKLFKLSEFKEDFECINFGNFKKVKKPSSLPSFPPSRPWIKNKLEILWQALTLGLHDFVKKSGLKKVHLGLSGGIDSALVACLATESLGCENVTCIGLPSSFNSPESLSLAKELSSALKTNWHELSIDKIYKMSQKLCKVSFGDFPFGVVDENLQSRLRNLFLMAFGNKNSSLLLNATNKSEMAMGYGTLYGDLAGGLCVIGDLLKSEVFQLSKHYNKKKEKEHGSSPIPLRILKRPPSAELKPNQTDQKELKLPYSLLDKKIEKLILKKTLLLNKKDKKFTEKLLKSEFKRWQAPPILKVSERAFGKGRRMPINFKLDL